MLTGLRDANVDGSPTIALTGQVESQVLGTGNFQEVDLEAAYGDVTEFEATVLPDSQYAELATRAAKTAILERGVSHLVFPGEIQTQSAEDVDPGDPEGRITDREMQRAFEEEGIDVVTGNDLQRVRAPAADGGAEAIQSGVAVETSVDGTERTVTADALFVATGVQPNSEEIGLETVGIETNDDGTIRIDEHFQTTNPDVYAAGDVIGEPELETVAAKEGNHAVKNAFADEGISIDYDSVPAVVFTSPEVASVGTTELEYMDEHGTCSCRTVQMEDVPRAKAVKNTDGLVQVVKHHETGEIVGVHMVGPRAADMIMEATLAVKFGLTVDDIIDTVHPFPTFSEAFKHACQTFRRDTSTMSCCVE